MAMYEGYIQNTDAVKQVDENKKTIKLAVNRIKQ